MRLCIISGLGGVFIMIWVLEDLWFGGRWERRRLG